METNVNLSELEEGARAAVLRGGVRGIRELLAVAEKHPTLTNVAVATPTSLPRRRGRAAVKAGESPEKPAKKAPPRGSAARGAKRSPDEMAKQAKAALDVIAAKSPIKMEDLAKATGLSTKELIIPVKSLVKDGKVKTAGQKRATTYSLAA